MKYNYCNEICKKIKKLEEINLKVLLLEEKN